MKTTGHKILITGGSSGIGLSITRKLLALGNDIIITGRNLQKLEAVKEELGRIDFICCDMAEPNAHLEISNQVIEKLGSLSILINNAGIQENNSFLDTPIEQIAKWSRQEIEINLTSVINLAAACLPHLRQMNSAAIVNISSGLAITPKSSAPVYCATKAAIHSFSQALRYQCEDQTPHINIFEVLPPLVDTAMTEGRGKNKLCPDDVADTLIKGLEKDTFDINVSKVKLLRIIQRLSPRIAANILRNS